MKIGVIHWAFPPVVGGVESHLVYLYEELARMGHKVSILTAPHPDRDPADYPWCRIVDDELMSIRYCLNYPGQDRYDRVREMMERFIEREDPDVIHAHNFHYFVPDHAECLDEISKKYGIPIVLTVHNYWKDDLCRHLLKDIGWDRLVAVSYYMKWPCIFDAKVDPDKMEVHYHGIDLNKYCALDGQRIKEQLGLAGRRVIFHPARACESKGSLHSIMAAGLLKDKYPDLCLILSGNGDSVDFDEERESFKARVGELLREYDMEKNVIFVSASGSEMPLYMNAADVVVYPTIFYKGEAFGIAPVEAMACGRPVIVTNSGGLVESTYHGINGLVVDKDPQTLARELAEGIDRLIADACLGEYLGKNGREVALERFDSRKMALRMENLYERLVSDSVMQRIKNTATRPRQGLKGAGCTTSRTT
ncbi:MAG TPA: glycosyltransferase family 4 protein [Methanocella sp.]|uniref:glycosyltransferase family 4 protein n=1 Tax=Methanocella sp. TaxID=2052833 RepID=UPI002C224211|nr:glycosyltransferase family 4 protein [Methanocella sp.]HTY91928.1 glycosyltransferase family 4 protein [Methanocella sp.]